MDLEARLRNWGRWARGGIKLQTCGSAEKFFRSNWRQWCSLQDIPYSAPMDVMDAELIEKVMRYLSVKERKAAKLRYVYRMDDYMAARRVGVKAHHVESFWAKLHYHIKNILDKQSVLWLNNAKSIKPRPLDGEITAPVGAVFA